MDSDVAPPAKRRRLSSVNDANQIELQGGDTQPSTGSFFHGIEHLKAAPAATSAVVEARPRLIEEVHLEIRHRPVGGIMEYPHIRARQGTAVTLDAVLSAPEVVVSIEASVDLFGATTALATDTLTVGASGGTLLSGPATTVSVVISPGGTSSSTASATISSAEETSSATESNTSVSSPGTTSLSAVTESSTSVSSLATTSLSIATNSSEVATSLSSDPTGLVSISAAGVSSSMSGSSASNSSSITTTAESSITALLSSSLSSSGRQNLTTSATTSSTFDAGNIYYATLTGGRVATITRSGRAYATTLPGGLVTTIQPSSPSRGSDSSLSTDASGVATTVVSDSSTFLSTVFATNSPSSTDNAMTTTVVGDPAGVAAGHANPTSSSISSTTSLAGGGSGPSTTPPAGTIAGGVVGGAAGLAVVLLVAMLFLRWYRRKGMLLHQALPASSTAAMSSDPDHFSTSRGNPGMAERAGLMPFVAAVPALFRHQNRSRDSTVDETATGERGFTRVSGRKLPSAWSEGMTSHPPPMPLVSSNYDRNLSNTSLYRDNAGVYGGTGDVRDDRADSPSDPFADSMPTETGNSPPGEDTQLVMSPGPQRTPTIHRGYVVSPSSASSDMQGMLSPSQNQPPWSAGTQATFSRSETPASMDGSRGSRFTEEV